MLCAGGIGGACAGCRRPAQALLDRPARPAPHQPRRYEAQGEYALPPSLPLPRSAADLALQPVAGGTGGGPGGGRWRVQVSVPAAELQEILPAARLLQSATSLPPAEYERVKAAFLQVGARGGWLAGWLAGRLAGRAAPCVQVAAGSRRCTCW